MDILIVLIPIALSLGATFAALFVVAVRAGQFDDLDDPPVRVLQDDESWSPGPISTRYSPPSGPRPSSGSASRTHTRGTTRPGGVLS